MTPRRRDQRRFVRAMKEGSVMPEPSYPDDYPDEDDCCPTCGGMMDWDSCWQCFGDGGWHDCGDDCCPCLDPDIDTYCDECGGKGGYLVCQSLPHKAEAKP